VPKIEVTFDIDANGILNVSAKDQATGRQSHITIQAGTGLSKEEIDKMVKDAQANAAADKSRKESIEVKNEADNAVYQAEKLIKENGEKIPADKKADLESKIKDVQAAITADDAPGMKKGVEDLRTALSAVGAAMYEANASAGPTAAGDEPPPPPNKDGDVVDGEFREQKS
jgi:molecular chaperone DnaK